MEATRETMGRIVCLLNDFTSLCSVGLYRWLAIVIRNQKFRLQTTVLALLQLLCDRQGTGYNKSGDVG